MSIATELLDRAEELRTCDNWGKGSLAPGEQCALYRRTEKPRVVFGRSLRLECVLSDEATLVLNRWVWENYDTIDDFADWNDLQENAGAVADKIEEIVAGMRWRGLWKELDFER